MRISARADYAVRAVLEVAVRQDGGPVKAESIAATQEIRDDDARGRHTTTRRQLHLLPDGGLVLDTPGMRELALWDADGLERSFSDVEELASA